ncbi:hypothetical protein NP493_161g02000 [Ridgeia piscesae]|uniref:AAA+ ATPase domain-containing protein n=1 Tax=Ridgeia piscesae TaxID=27915 RepID=A0AAD9P3N5_RIDPI|nr:hypothetical protein NP493_161g02000 [Ridgeia piscesae]
MMKRKHSEGRLNPTFQQDVQSSKLPYVSDPKLIARVQQYLEGSKSQMVNISLMAEDIQKRYSDYRRKKKQAFTKAVEKAYEAVCLKQGGDNYSSLELKHLQKQHKLSQQSGEPSSDSSDSDMEKSFSSDNHEYVNYKDTNSMNSCLTDLYKGGTPNTSRLGTPRGSQPSSRAGTPSRSLPHSDPPSGQSSPRRTSSWCGKDGDHGDSRDLEKALFVIDRVGNLKQKGKVVAESPLAADRRKTSTNSGSDMCIDSTEAVSSVNKCVDVTLHVQQREVKKDDLSTSINRDVEKSVNAETETKQVEDTTPVTEEAGTLSKSSTGKKMKKKKSKDGEDKKKTTKGPEPTQSTVKFADIGGCEAALLEVCKLLVHMKHPEVYQRLGVTPPRGFLLHGPPGCGKTLLAHAIAGELQLPFIKLAATEVVSGVSGESEEKLRNIFNSATASAPCILFLDEIDAITPKRENASKDMERRIVAQLLTCMDDLNNKSTGHVLVIGATNRPDSIDPALRRAGRFDREISLGIPDEAARVRILKVLCRDLRLGSEFDFGQLAHNTPGYVGADLMALAREAAITAVNRVFQALKSEKMTKEVKAINVTGGCCVPQKEALTTETEKTTDSSETVVTTVTADDVTVTDVTADSVTDTDVTIGDVTLDTVDKPKPVSDNDTVAVRETSVTMATLDMTVTEKCDIVEELDSVLGWLKDTPPLSDDQLSSLFITMADFEMALTKVQPSAKREGFATIPGVTWDDIGALHDIRQELQMAILAPVKHRAQFAALGLTTPPGVLLAGPPGCGKTLLAKAVANESGINFISVKGPELLNMYVGESERAIRQVFLRARDSAPCVIFFDELDALCPRRSHGGEGGASVRVVNQLLTEMDGLEERKQVFVMAATNRPDIIDPAMLRPGRLDKILYVGLPSCKDRADILIAVTKNGTQPRLRKDVCLETVAADPRCNNFTGADLAALVREAAVASLQEFLVSQHPPWETPAVGGEHFDVAFHKVTPSVSDKVNITFSYPDTTTSGY